jgi:cytochrome P450
VAPREMSPETLSDSAVGEELYSLFAKWRRDTPVRDGDVLVELGVPTSLASAGRQTFTLLRYDDVVVALRDPATFSTEIYRELFAGSPIGESASVLLGSEGEGHRTWRRQLMPVFARKPLLAWDEEVIRPEARRCAEEFAVGRKSADLADYASQFPMRMIYGLMGIGDDEEYERFRTEAGALLLTYRVHADPAQRKRNAERGAEANRALYDMILPCVQRKRAEGAIGSDLTSYLIRAEVEGRTLSDGEITEFVRNSLPAATETTTRQFLNMMTLLERPDQLDALRTDRTPIPRAVAESAARPRRGSAADSASRSRRVRGIADDYSAHQSVASHRVETLTILSAVEHDVKVDARESPAGVCANAPKVPLTEHQRQGGFWA